MTPSSIVRKTALAGSVMLLAACGDGLTLPPATLPSVQNEIHLFALTGTSVNTNSAYNISAVREVSTVVSNDFDFAFDLRFDSAYGIGKPGDTVAVLIPLGALGFSPDAGLQQMPVPPAFELYTLSPTAGYEKQKAVRIRAGDVLFASSRVAACQFGFVRPFYAKMLVEAIDVPNRVATIRLVIDPNCGYREVTAGIPTQ